MFRLTTVGFLSALIASCALEVLCFVRLNEQSLKEIVFDLQRYAPKSYQMQAVIRNYLSKKFYWPGTEFVADQYPDYSHISMRPIRGTADYQDCFYTDRLCYLFFTKNGTSFPAFVRQKDLITWTEKLLFFAVPRWDVYPALQRESESRKNTSATVSTSPNDNFTYAILLNTTLMPRKKVPEDLYLGELGPQHAFQINSEWRHGSNATIPFFKYLLDNSFPSSALFTKNDNRLIGYVLYQPDGCIGGGYVNPNYRGRGLFHIVNRDLAEKIIAMGQPGVFAWVRNNNVNSLRSYRKMGATQLDEHFYSTKGLLFP